MVFNRIYLIATALALLSCSEDHNYTQLNKHEDIRKVTAQQLKVDRSHGVVYFNNELFTGTSIQYFLDSTMSESIEYVHGKKHGKFRKYFPDGSLSFSGEYKNNRRDGLTTSWWSNGNMRSTANYIAGIAEGEQLQWYKSGAIFKKINLINGVELGLQQSWRENGKLYNNYEAKNGRIFGLKRASLCFQLDDEVVISNR